MQTYEVLDARPEIRRQRKGLAKHVGTLRNVPSTWTADDVLRRFGIARHLRVLHVEGDGHVVVQEGRA